MKLTDPVQPVFFRGNPAVEFFRKIGVRLGVTADFIDLDYFRIVKKQQVMREKIPGLAGIYSPGRECRFLLRVDDFPSSRADSESFIKFHEIAKANHVPYLLAVTPFLERNGTASFFTEAERKILGTCARDGAEIALHGFTHCRRNGVYPSELLGMPRQELSRELEKAEKYFSEIGLKAIAFVAPFNSYDETVIDLLAEHFSLLCGGPESVRSFGYRGPSFFKKSYYMPSYRPVYDITERSLPVLDWFEREAAGFWIPITIHWANGLKDNFKFFEKLCKRLSGHCHSWNQFLQEVGDL